MSSTTPLIPHNQQLFAPIEVSGDAGYAIIDTGANTSTLVSSQARDCAHLDPLQVYSALGDHVVERCLIPSLDFLQHTFQEVPAFVQDDLHVEPPQSCRPLLLRAGVDLLFSHSLYLGCTGQHIAFLDASVPQRSRPRLTLPLATVHGLALFTITLSGTSYRALFDTGAGISVLHSRYQDTLSAEFAAGEALETRDATGATQWIPTFQHPQLQLDEHPLGPIRFLLIDLDAVENQLNTQVDVVFGYEAIAQWDWIIDPTRGSLHQLDNET